MAEPSIADILRDMAKTAEERAEIYGPAYLRFGEVMKALYPSGLHIDTPSQFVRVGVIVQIVNKLVRFTAQPQGHLDSAHDIGVYGAMLEKVMRGVA